MQATSLNKFALGGDIVPPRVPTYTLVRPTEIGKVDSLRYSLTADLVSLPRVWVYRSDMLGSLRCVFIIM